MNPQMYVAAGAVLILGGTALPFATSVPIWVGLTLGLIGLVLAVRAVIADSSHGTSAIATDGSRNSAVRAWE
jgi:hypothetical protein